MLELEAAPPPRPDAAVDDVPDVLSAVPLREARGHGGALARGADHRQRRGRVERVRQRVQVVVGDVDGAGDAAAVSLRALAHVEHLDRAPSFQSSCSSGTVTRRVSITGPFSSRHAVIPPCR